MSPGAQPIQRIDHCQIANAPDPFRASASGTGQSLARHSANPRVRAAWARPFVLALPCSATLPTHLPSQVLFSQWEVVMKRIFALALAAVTLAPPVFAADVGVSVEISQPGVFGRIDIGRFPQPAVIVPQPMIIAPPVVRVQP